MLKILAPPEQFRFVMQTLLQYEFSSPSFYENPRALRACLNSPQRALTEWNIICRMN